jgi:hypothetical protein
MARTLSARETEAVSKSDDIAPGPAPPRREEILERALSYPYAVPERSFLYLDGEALELPAVQPEATDGAPGIDVNAQLRGPLLAYGANAAPEALARKLASVPDLPLPVIRAELGGFDVVYSAHVSPYGAVPATLHESPGTTAPVFVLLPTAEQRALLAASEPNYELTRLSGIELRLEPASGLSDLSEVEAFLSRHGCLRLAGAPVALTAIRSAGRSFEELDEPAVLERIRALHSPQLDLEPFVRACVASGGLAPLPASWPR